MRRRAAMTAMLAGVVLVPSLEARGAKRYLKKESTADMKGMRRIFLGWIDLVPDDWVLHGYGDKAEWVDVINRLNYFLLRGCQTNFLTGRNVTAAKAKGDEDARDSDLYVKFSDVRISYDEYRVYLSIHFIDPKTNAELATIPQRPYFGNDWGFERYLKAALDEVAVKLQVEILGGVQKRM